MTKTPEHSSKRTSQQNRALHLFFTLLADELNGAGYDMKKFLKAHVDIPWTPENIKNHIWKPVQEVYLGKKSTTELTTKEIDKIWEIINRHTSSMGISVPFPSLEDPEI